MNKNLITQISRDLKETIESMIAQILIKSKVPANSDLVKTIELKDNSRTNSLFIWVNHYYEYLSKGRKPGTKKIPLHALITWLKKYNIKSNKIKNINSLAFVIQRSIFLKGIKARNYKDTVENSVTDLVEIKLAENFEELVSESIIKSLKFNGKFITS